MPDTVLAGASDDKLLTAPEVAAALSLPENWIREKTRAGQVPHLRFGKYVRYQLGDVQAWMDGLKVDRR